MSSTSSSECMCGECFNYGPGGFMPSAPYYQTLGQPLIYYAQVQQTPNFRRRNRESRQESPNCFVKAFRWYTQERCQPQHRELPSDRTDLTGFGVWLDKKYDEFMLDKQAEQNSFQDPPERTATLGSLADQNPNQSQSQPTADLVEQNAYPVQTKHTTILANQNGTSVVCDVRIKKKFARMRSPWKKRRRPVNGNEAGDLLEKCNQSCEFIMKPKELCRQASECSHQASRNQSNISTGTQASKKTVLKAPSSDRTEYEKRNNTPIEVIKIERTCSKISRIAPTRSKSEIQSHPETLTKEINDEICQFPEEKIEIVDVKVQCTIIDREGLVKCPQCDCNTNTNVIRENRDPVQFSEGPPQVLKVRNTDVMTDNGKPDQLSKVPSQVRDEDGSKPIKYSASKLSKDETAKCDTNISCQCSEIKVVKKDAQSQHPPEQKDAVVCGCCISYNEIKPLSRASSSHQNHPKIVLPSPPCPCLNNAIPLEPRLPLMIKDAGTGTAKSTPKVVPITFASGEAQTSNHSICLDKNTYPLFMKIVCADKLNEEFTRK